MNESIKNDYKDHKLRWDLLPLAEIEDIVKVYTAGADKYGPNKWQGLPDGYNRYKGAMLRHLMEFEKGNPIDEETGCLHLAQVAWNAIAMLYCSKQNNKSKQDQMLEALDKRIKEKIDNCNKILDEISDENKKAEQENALLSFATDISTEKIRYVSDIKHLCKLLQKDYLIYQGRIVRVEYKEVDQNSTTRYEISVTEYSNDDLIFAMFAYNYKELYDMIKKLRTDLKETKYDV